MAISTICRGGRIVLEAARAVNAAEKFLESSGSDETEFLRKTSLANKCFLLLTTIGEMIGIMNGSSFSALGKWKNLELMGRALDVVIKMEEADQRVSVPECFEQGVLSSVVSLFRAANEVWIYQAKELLGLPAEEFAKLRRPVFDRNEDVIGFKTITKEEYERTKEEYERQLSTAQRAEPILNIAEVTFMSGACTKTAQAAQDIKDQISNIYRALARRLRAQQAGPQMPQPDPLNLLALNEIPAELHNDAIFQRYICPITQLPIRHPVEDPNGVTLYERSAIQKWIFRKGTSPVTNHPLRRHQLQAKPALQSLIDKRLAYHEKRLRAEAEIAKFQRQADVENPNY